MDSWPEARPRPEAGFKGESVRSRESCVRATRRRGRRFSPPRAGKEGDEPYVPHVPYVRYTHRLWDIVIIKGGELLEHWG